MSTSPGPQDRVFGALQFDDDDDEPISIHNVDEDMLVETVGGTKIDNLTLEGNAVTKISDVPTPFDFPNRSKFGNWRDSSWTSRAQEALWSNRDEDVIKRRRQEDPIVLEPRPRVVPTPSVVVIPPPPVVPVRYSLERPAHEVVPHGRSVMNQFYNSISSQKCLPNVMFSSSFRVSWGPDGQLAIPSFASLQRCSAFDVTDEYHQKKNMSSVGVQIQRITATMSDDIRLVKNRYLPSLNASLDSLEITNTENGTITPSTGVIHFDTNGNSLQGPSLLKFTKLVARHKQEAESELAMYRDHIFKSTPKEYTNPIPIHRLHEISIKHSVEAWSLIWHLWGNENAIEDMEWEINDVRAGEYRRMDIRRRLDQWLQEVSVNTSDEDLECAKAIASNDQALQECLILLTAKRFNEARAKLWSIGDRRLAMLISCTTSLSKSHRTSDALNNQLQLWNQRQCSELISPWRKALYRLLSGDLAILQEGLPYMEWKRRFGCFLWYKADPSKSIEECVLDFVAQNTINRWMPFPNYMQEIQYFAEELYLKSKEQIGEDIEIQKQRLLVQEMATSSQIYHDGCFLLLMLFCRRDTKLDPLMYPMCHNYNSLDHSLPWHLVTLLKDLHYRLSNEQYGRLTVGFSSQLESEGLWQWAIYVLLHLPQSNSLYSRELMIKKVLQRHYISEHDQEIKNFLTCNLCIPNEWLEESMTYWKSYDECKSKSAHPTITHNNTPNKVLTEQCLLMNLVSQKLIIN